VAVWYGKEWWICGGFLLIDDELVGAFEIATQAGMFVELGQLTREWMDQRRAPLQGTFGMSVAGDDRNSWCALAESYTRRLFTVNLGYNS
jgi:hypothetical protein